MPDVALGMGNGTAFLVLAVSSKMSRVGGEVRFCSAYIWTASLTSSVARSESEEEVERESEHAIWSTTWLNVTFLPCMESLGDMNPAIPGIWTNKARVPLIHATSARKAFHSIG